ncbi:helix-turn-helix domain-containing protein [Flavobacteriaceae bacterium]|nr:helix-turn-helix domain-containing protein [Flavobacteriaceae bacterium]MDC0378385.1 helix-turn-helix domain-containing protein [Flavobacteriaceae bacterium]|tara:strand:+ start:1463 stop:1639 length:177 start_codon:yes stop_codon:yes gene_type:complete
MEKRISKQELEKIYGVNRKTIEDWVKNHDLPMIQISPYKRFVRESDLLDWERTHELQT